MRLYYSLILSLLFGLSLSASIPHELNKTRDSLAIILDENRELQNSLLVEVYQDMSYLYLAYYPKTAFQYLDSAEAVAQLKENRRYLAGIYIQRGTHRTEKGEYAQAVTDYIIGLNYYEQYSSSYWGMFGYPYIKFGNLYYKIQQYDQAINIYRQSVKYFESENEKQREDQIGYGQAVAYNNIALCKLELDEPDSALYYFNVALDYRKIIGRQDLLEHSYLYLANTYLKLEQADKADSLYNLIEGNTYLDTTSKIYKDLIIGRAEILILRKDYTGAKNLLFKVIDFYTGSFSDFMNIEAYLKLSHIERDLGNIQKALKYAKIGYERALMAGKFDLNIQFLETFKELEYKLGHYKEALKYSGLIINFQDSTLKNQSQILKDFLKLNMALGEKVAENENVKEINIAQKNVIKSKNILLILLATLSLVFVVVVIIVSRLNKKIKRARAIHQEFNRRILAVINSTDNVIVSLSEKHVVQFINTSGEKFFKSLFGKKVRQGDNFLDKIESPELLHDWKTCIQKAKENGTWKEVLEVRLEGKIHYMFKNFSSVLGINNQYTGVVLVAADVTKDREANLKIEKQKEELAQSNQAKEKMLSILAHDLKDSIFSAKALAELVLSHPDDHSKEELLDFFRMLDDNFGKTRNLLKGLLDWVKTQSSGMRASIEAVEVEGIMEQVIALSDQRIKKKHISVEVKTGGPVEVMGDREMLKTVLRNLVNNAIKYVEPKTGEILLKAEKKDKLVRISIVDNGKGMSPEVQAKILDSPGRISTPGTLNEPGTGFGLNLSNQLLKHMDSYLQFVSKEDEGSTFYFDLPS